MKHERPKFADRPKWQQVLVKLLDGIMYNYNPVYVYLQKRKYAKIMAKAKETDRNVEI
jgi:hypothetical protein